MRKLRKMADSKTDHKDATKRQEKIQKPPSEATSTVSRLLGDMTNSRDIQEIVDSQTHILDRYERSNETLSAVNDFASTRFEAIHQNFHKNSLMLLEMKKNLDNIFRRLRSVKQTLRTNYPEAYEASKVEYIPPDDDSEPLEPHEAPNPSGKDDSLQ